jgi:DNA repair ATPase RecN
MMKNYLLILFLAFSVQMMGQEIVEQDRTMSKGLHNGFYIEIPGAEKKQVEKIWKNYLKEFSKKVKDKKGEYYTEEANIPLINGANQLIVYAKVEEGMDQSTIYTWVDLGGAFLNSGEHASQYDGFAQFLEDFYYEVRRDVVKKELEDAEDMLKDIQKDLEKLQDKNKDYHRDIEKAQEKIREAEDKITKNIKEQDDVQIKLEKQKREVEKIMEKFNNVGKAS